MPNPATPRLQGAKAVRFQLNGRHHADVSGQVEVVEDAWRDARRILSRAGGLCHCGNRWGHLMNGVEVTLLDKAPYTARCWDDDRLLIHLKKFSEEPDGGVGVLVHEFGHRVWFQCLSREQQDEWTASFKKAKSHCSVRQRTTAEVSSASTRTKTIWRTSPRPFARSSTARSTRRTFSAGWTSADATAWSWQKPFWRSFEQLFGGRLREGLGARSEARSP